MQYDKADILDCLVTALVIVMAILLLTSCAKHVAVAGPQVDHPRWSYLPNPEDHNVLLLVRDDQDLDAALKAMGCGVCTVGAEGMLYTVNILQREGQ